MPKPTVAKPFMPKDFQVNSTWLAYRANRSPLPIEDGEADVFILQDAGSMFIFGNAFAPAGAECPSAPDAARMLHDAWASKSEWPMELLLPGQPTEDNSFARAAAWNGVLVKAVPEHQLSFFMEDVRSSYEEYLNRGSDSDA